MNNPSDIKMTAEEVQERLAVSPYIEFLGLKVDFVDHEAQTIQMTLPMRQAFERRANTGQIHGGVIASVIDIVGDFAIGMLVGTGIPTVNFRVDYLRPATNSALRSVAVVRKMGRSLGVADVDVYDEAGKLVAIGRGTYAIIKSSS